jgi:hypothetical protein
MGGFVISRPSSRSLHGRLARVTFTHTGPGVIAIAVMASIPDVSTFPRVFAASGALVTYEGIQIGPLAVELWDDRWTVVRIAGVPVTRDAKERARVFRAAHREWTAQVAAHARSHEGSVDGAPLGPLHPLGDATDSLTVAVTDDQGTSYRWRSSGWGGVSWDFTSEARFEPVVEASVVELTIRILVKGGESGAIVVPLG